MALKDWEKNPYGYHHKTKPDTIHIESFDEGQYSFALFKGEQLQDGTRRKGEFYKALKSNALAHKYAKLYMRKH